MLLMEFLGIMEVGFSFRTIQIQIGNFLFESLYFSRWDIWSIFYGLCGFSQCFQHLSWPKCSTSFLSSLENYPRPLFKDIWRLSGLIGLIAGFVIFLMCFITITKLYNKLVQFRSYLFLSFSTSDCFVFFLGALESSEDIKRICSRAW